MKKIRVLVVDDSALIRRIIGDIIRQSPDMELVGIAHNGLDAINKIKLLLPDVITLDLEMPMMDGLTALKEIMAIKPIPVIMVSSHTKIGSQKTMEALSGGAFDFVTKPDKRSRDENTEELNKVLPAKIKVASTSSLDSELKKREVKANPLYRAVKKSSSNKMAGMIIAIGSSTGGPRALEEVLRNLPGNIPASILVTQHMPAGFTASLAERLNHISSLKIKEAQKGDKLIEGCAYIAPGGYHMIIKGTEIYLDNGPKVNHVRPSVDVMLDSLIDWPHRIITVILTGMGRDGARGVENLKEHKKDTLVIAQDPETSVVRGMPEAVINTGLCDVVVQLKDVPGQITTLLQSRRS